MPLPSSRKPSPSSCPSRRLFALPILVAMAVVGHSAVGQSQSQNPAPSKASGKSAASLQASAANINGGSTDFNALLMAGPSGAGLPSNWQLQASNLNGDAFTPSQLRGRVAVVFYWSTNCAVCRDTLPELRANLAGWGKKPVSVVQVNVDKLADDWRSYEQIRNVMHKPVPGLHSLHLDAGPSPNKLPLTLVVDTQNRVVRRYEGRIAPEAWNDVADLLP